MKYLLIWATTTKFENCFASGGHCPTNNLDEICSYRKRPTASSILWKHKALHDVDEIISQGFDHGFNNV